MERIYKVIVLLVSITEIISAKVEPREKLTLRIGEHITSKNCNQTLQNIQSILTETSQNIFNFTNGRVQLKDITIQLPLSWQVDHCAPPSAIVSNFNEEPDVKISSSHPLLGDLPWTIQFAGCQQAGKNIELPYEFVGKNRTMAQKSSLLTKEWIKLRFGVFEEDGFDGDNLYPSSFVEGKSNMSNSACPDKHQGFCNGSIYNEDLPTKQNILCGRKSVKSIVDSELTPETPSTTPTNISAKIRDPASFSVSSEPAFLPPIFHVQIPARKRFVVVLERSSAMGLNNRWSLLHGELFRFISSLPNDVELAVVTFGKTASLILTPTLLSMDNREGVYGRIPRRHLEDDTTCLECAMRLAIKTLSMGGRSSGGSLLLITASTARPTGFTELVHSIKEGSNQVHTVAFEKSVFYEARHLGQFGKTFIVHENNHDVLASAVNISDIFTSILSQSGGIDVQKFHQELLISNDANMVSGNFVVEESLRNNLWVEISSPDQDDIEYFELTNPTGKVFQFPKFEHGLVYFKLAGIQEPGIWSFKAKLFQKVQYSRVSVQALAEPSNKEWAKLEAWTSVDHEGVNALETPVMVYARIVRDNSPILNAEVVATIHRPGNAEPVSIALRDNGSGYPDITTGDGIYSAYFTQFTSEPGFYSVVVTARNKEGQASLPRLTDSEREHDKKCCGSSMPFSFTVPTTPFARHALSGSFFVQEGSQFYLRQGSPHRNDVYPPSRITDFKLANYLENSLYVTLMWTAPGNDFDFGQAFRYEIRCYTNREALREENFTDMGILVHTSLIPIPESYNSEQRSTVGIPWPNEVFYYAIVAYDEEGNRGQVSNVISVFAEEKPPTPTPSVGFDQAILENEAYPHHESLPLTAGNSDTLIYIVSGVVSALLVVILLIVVATLLRSRWNKQIKQSSSSQGYARDYESSLAGTLKKVASLPDITKDNTLNDAQVWRDTDSCGKDSINKSPIPSISDNFSWKYLTPPRATGQEVPGVHRVLSDNHHSQSYQPPSTDSSMYSSNDSETTASAEFILGPGPRISVMEDYTVYRDLSHLDSLNQDYFSISQLPKELQGMSMVPYSPGFDTMESQKRRHISLV